MSGNVQSSRLRGHVDANGVTSGVGLNDGDESIANFICALAAERDACLDTVLGVDRQLALRLAAAAAAAAQGARFLVGDVSNVIQGNEVARSGAAAMRHLNVIAVERPLGAAAAAEAHATRLHALGGV